MEQGIAGAILSWLGGQNVVAPTLRADGGEEPIGFLIRRLDAIAEQVSRGRALPLLSAPTHRGGWSDVRDRESIGYLEPLAEAHTEMGPAACHALALGLAAKDVTLRGHAKEGLIAAVVEGRANARELGAAMAHHVHTAGNKLAWWALCLGEVAQVSREHALVVFEVLQLTLHAAPAPPPKDLGALLERLFEVASELGMGVSDELARAYLSNLKAGRVGKLAAQVLRR